VRGLTIQQYNHLIIMLKKILKKYTTPALLAFLIALPCYAATFTNPLGDVTIPGLIGKIIKSAVGIVGSLALLLFIFGGFTWMTSGGNEEKVKKAQNILKSAVLGILIIFTSYALLNLLFSILQG